jgi:hypothetical protein
MQTVNAPANAHQIGIRNAMESDEQLWHIVIIDENAHRVIPPSFGLYKERLVNEGVMWALRARKPGVTDAGYAPGSRYVALSCESKRPHNGVSIIASSLQPRTRVR